MHPRGRFNWPSLPCSLQFLIQLIIWSVRKESTSNFIFNQKMYSIFIKISMVVHTWAEHSQISTIQTATLVHSVSCLSVCICLVQHTVKLVYAKQFAKLFILRSMAWGVGSSMENGKRWPWLLYYHRVTHLLVVVGFFGILCALPGKECRDSGRNKSIKKELVCTKVDRHV